MDGAVADIPTARFPVLANPPAQDDPIVFVPLNVDRLRCAVTALSELFRCALSGWLCFIDSGLRTCVRFTSVRPVQMPIGPLVQLAQAMLSCTNEDKASSIFLVS